MTIIQILSYRFDYQDPRYLTLVLIDVLRSIMLKPSLSYIIMDYKFFYTSFFQLKPIVIKFEKIYFTIFIVSLVQMLSNIVLFSKTGLNDKKIGSLWQMKTFSSLHFLICICLCTECVAVENKNKLPENDRQM